MFTHLKPYTRPDHFADFADFDRTEYFVFLGQHRDSDTLTRSNFIEGLKAIGGETDTVRIIRDSHCLVGWVESIYIHASDLKACAAADEVLRDLEDYPVVNEDGWATLQSDEAFDYWRQMSVKDRVYVCQKFRVSIFAARRSDDIPEDRTGEIINYLSDGV